MRKIILSFALISIAFIATAQVSPTDSSKYSNLNSHGTRFKRAVADSGFGLPLIPYISGDPYRAGFLYFNKTDSSIYAWTGYQWLKQGGSGGGSGSVTSVGFSSSDLSVSGSPITSSGTITANLNNTSVTPGTYGTATQVPQLTVDAKGRLTGVSNLSISFPPSNLGIVRTSTDNTVTNSNGTGFVIPQATTALAGVMAAADKARLDSNYYLQNAPGSGSNVLKKHNDSTTYARKIAFRGAGVDTSASTADVLDVNIAGGGGGGSGTVTSVAVSSTDLSVSGSPITTSGTITANLNTTGVTAGTYGSATQVPQLTVDGKGRITLATALTVAPPKKAFYYASDYGIYPDNTDITAKLISLDAVMQANGGGILIFDSACNNSRAYRINGRIQLAHNGALLPYQSPRKWMGLGSTRRGAGSYSLRGSTVFDMRFTADSNSAQIDTRGIGSFEITGIDMVHTVDVNRTRFMHTTNTVIYIHDNYFKGFNSGSGANEDVAIWGGKNGGASDSLYNSPFQGYGSKFENNVLDGIQSGVIMQRYCNNNWVRDNNFWNTCGGNAAIIINSYDNAQGDVGNVIEGNLIQTNNYVYAVKIHGGLHNTIIGNSSFDGGVSLQAVVYISPNSLYNVVHAAKGENSAPYMNVDAEVNNWYYPSEQNGRNIMPFGFKANGSVSEFSTASARVKNLSNNDSHFFETNNNTVDLRFSDNNGADDYIASFQYFGTAVNKLRLIGTSYGGIVADADLRLQSNNNTIWFNDQAYMLNQTLYSNADGIPAFRMRNTGQISFSGTTSASGAESHIVRDSTNQIAFTNGASSYIGFKIGKIYATAPAQYAANYGASFTDRSLVDKGYVDSSGNANFDTLQNFTITSQVQFNGTEYSNDFKVYQVDSFHVDASKVNLMGAVAYTSKQNITSGTATTIQNYLSRVIVNPGSVLATHTITMPAAPTDGQRVSIYFGGSIGGGSPVVTALTISANTGQTLMQSTTPTTAVGGDCLIYVYNSANTTWYREK